MTKAQKLLKEKNTIVIDRRKWGRGLDGGELLNREGKMCCLGFLSLACGISKKNISRRGMPSDINFKKLRSFNRDVIDKFVGKFSNNVDFDKDDTKRLASINDFEMSSDKVKENLIKRKFKKLGIEVKFVN